ncbi:MAG: Gfo/Idh/MocA family oxidoreductase [Inquilinus sp.]|nr:Gfo/Idh/MocA family oxidoreductase [Inquilinus sp.]
MAKAPLRIAVIGAGLIGRRHIDCVRDEPGAALAGVVEPDQRVAAAVGETGVTVRRDIDALAAAGPVDAAIVATPNAAHREGAMDCLRRGWAVLVEKPIADTPEAGAEIVAAAKERGAPLLVGHHRRHHDCVAVARRLIAEGGLGRLAAVSVQWAARKPDEYFAQAWRMSAAGGPVMINLIHDIDLLRHLCGEIVGVTAETGSALRGGEVEDSAAVLLRFADGALGTITLTDSALSPWSWEAASGENPGIAAGGQAPYRLMGTQASLELPSMRLWRADHAGADWSTPLECETVPSRRTDPLPAQLRHFIAVARGEALPLVGGEDGLATLVATRAVIESASTHKTVRLGGGPENQPVGERIG